MSDELHNEEDTHNEARQLHQAVNEHLEEGHLDKAKLVFSRTWRDAVPELPFRFHPILVRPDTQAVMALRARLRPGVPVPELRLRYVGGKRNPQAVEVWTVGRPRLHLGDLPGQDIKFLCEIGQDADLYRPSLLEIRVTEGMKLDYIAIELAREEVRFCAGCGTSHDGPSVFCPDCFARRTESGEVPEEYYEATPIAFHEVVEAIAAEHAPEDEEDVF